MVLLIPRRIKQLKEEGRAEGRAQERGRVSDLLARHDRGEISTEQFHAILAERCNGDRNGD